MAQIGKLGSLPPKLAAQSQVSRIRTDQTGDEVEDLAKVLNPGTNPLPRLVYQEARLPPPPPPFRLPHFVLMLPEAIKPLQNPIDFDVGVKQMINTFPLKPVRL